jgi:hypothetical protein
MPKRLQEHMLQLVQVKALLEQGQEQAQVKVQQDLVQQDLVQQVMALLEQVKSMELLNIHQIHLSSSIRKPGTLT